MIFKDPIDREIITKLEYLNGEQKKSILSVVKSFVNKNEDWWENLSKTHQDEIDLSLQEAEMGKVKAHKNVMMKYSKWPKKK